MDNKKIYTLLAQTPQEKQTWLTSLDGLITGFLAKEKVTEQRGRTNTGSNPSLGGLGGSPVLQSNSQLSVPFRAAVARRQTIDQVTHPVLTTIASAVLAEQGSANGIESLNGSSGDLTQSSMYITSASLSFFLFLFLSLSLSLFH